MTVNRIYNRRCLVINTNNAKLTQKKIDLRSDTVTLPTEEMREAMRNAEVGDDVYREDPSIIRLEKLAAEKMGKEAALFVPTGTMGNLIAILAHCQRGEEVILGAESHINYYEVGGISAVAGVIPNAIPGDSKEALTSDVIKKALREENVHYPETSLICLENTHNRAGGTICSPQITKEIYQLAQQKNIRVHLDGARLFDAAVALNIQPDVLVKDVDSVMFCLSKGLSAPVGSILAGSGKFIEKTRKQRKMLGGGMRQAGILAAAGIVALEKMVDRLKEDHDNARILGEGLSGIDGISVDLKTVQTNMVYFDLQQSGMDTYQFLNKLAKYNILGASRPPTKVRLVTHYGINKEDVFITIEAIKNIMRSL